MKRDCAEYEVWMSAAIDGELDAGEVQELEFHTTQCPQCHQQYQRFESLNDWLIQQDSAAAGIWVREPDKRAACVPATAAGHSGESPGSRPGIGTPNGQVGQGPLNGQGHGLMNGTPQPSQLQPSQLQPSQLQPSQLQPSQLQPSQLQPSELQPSELESPIPHRRRSSGLRGRAWLGGGLLAATAAGLASLMSVGDDPAINAPTVADVLLPVEKVVYLNEQSQFIQLSQARVMQQELRTLKLMAQFSSGDPAEIESIEQKIDSLMRRVQELHDSPLNPPLNP